MFGIGQWFAPGIQSATDVFTYLQSVISLGVTVPNNRPGVSLREVWAYFDIGIHRFCSVCLALYDTNSRDSRPHYPLVLVFLYFNSLALWLRRLIFCLGLAAEMANVKPSDRSIHDFTPISMYKECTFACWSFNRWKHTLLTATRDLTSRLEMTMFVYDGCIPHLTSFWIPLPWRIPLGM